MIDNTLKIFLSLSLLFISRLSFAQNEQITVEMNHYVQDAKSIKLKSLIPIYKYTGQPIEDPINNGLGEKTKFGYFNAKLPNMTGIRDTSYGFIFYGGIDERKDLPGYVLIVLGQNLRNTKYALIWVDRNYNLDLSDDGAPDTMYEGNSYLDLNFVHPITSNAIYTVSLNRIPISGGLPPYLIMLQDYYRTNSGSKKFESIYSSLGELRLNTIAGDFKNEKDSFRLGIKDFNCNGLYNEAEKDYLLLGKYGEDVLPDKRIEISKKKGKTYFEHNGIRYNIVYIDPVGAKVKIEIDTNAVLENSLVIGKKVKKFKYKLVSEEKDKKVSIKKRRRKPTYIYVWHLGQEGFTEDTSALRIIARDFSDRINLVTLNYGETPKQIKAFKRINRINWKIGQATMAINDILHLEQFPHMILTGKRLKIKQLKISPKELLLLLQNNLI
jgi:hypothetical protein